MAFSYNGANLVYLTFLIDESSQPVTKSSRQSIDIYGGYTISISGTMPGPGNRDINKTMAPVL